MILQVPNFFGREVDFLNQIDQIASSVNIESILFRLNVLGLSFGSLQNHKILNVAILNKQLYATGCSFLLNVY